MKTKIVLFLAAVLAVFSLSTAVHADEYLRVGMEAAYALHARASQDNGSEFAERLYAG